MAGFGSKMSHKTENHSWLSQNLWYFDEIKSFWKLLLSPEKKLNLILGMASAGLVFAQIGS